MAHQHLKFQFDPTNSKIWQPVLGGQVHGTFFMIYMKILDFEEHNKDEEGKYIYSCHFKLQNFRGAITIGLADVNSETSIVEVEDLKAKEVVQIDTTVKPFYKNDELCDVVLKFENKIEKEMLCVIRLLLSSPPIELFNPSDLDNSLYINPYTHFRDGDEFDEVTRRKVGETDWPEPGDSAGLGTGFCLPDIFWFWW